MKILAFAAVVPGSSNKYWEQGTFDWTETQACRYRIKLVADVVLQGMEADLQLAGEG